MVPISNLCDHLWPYIFKLTLGYRHSGALFYHNIFNIRISGYGTVKEEMNIINLVMHNSPVPLNKAFNAKCKNIT